MGCPLHTIVDVVQATKGILCTWSPTSLDAVTFPVLLQVKVMDSPDRVVVENVICLSPVVAGGNHVTRRIIEVTYREGSSF